MEKNLLDFEVKESLLLMQKFPNAENFQKQMFLFIFDQFIEVFNNYMKRYEEILDFGSTPSLMVRNNSFFKYKLKCMTDLSEKFEHLFSNYVIFGQLSEELLKNIKKDDLNELSQSMNELNSGLEEWIDAYESVLQKSNLKNILFKFFKK